MPQYSMARNSSDYLSGQPDARTGLFAKTLTIASLKGNYRAGPDFKLQLGFDPQQDFINNRGLTLSGTKTHAKLSSIPAASAIQTSVSIQWSELV